MPQYQGVWTLEQQAQAQSNQQWVTDPNFKNTTLLLQADGTGSGSQNQTFLDGSTNNFFITRNGNTTQGSFSPFSQAPGYWGNYFASANSSYLTVASNVAFALGTGDFTIEFWFYPTTATGQRNITFPTVGAPIFYMNSSSQLQFENYGTSPSITTTNTLTLNAWNHCAVSRASGVVNVYVNGISGVTSSAFSAVNFVQSSVNIGTDAGSNFTNGYLSNVRIVKGTAVYTSNFTPSAQPLTAVTNTSLLTCQNNRFIDNSANAFAITANGSPSVQAFAPFAPALQWTPDVVGGSGYFDGSDYLNTSSTLIGTTATTFTMEGWIYMTATPVSSGNIPGLCGDMLGSASTNYMSFGPLANLTLGFQWFNGSSNVTAAGNTVMTLNAWNHVAISINANAIKMFVNGVDQTITGTSTLTNRGGTSSQFTVGYNSTQASITGYVSSLRVTSTAVYTATFTPPTAPLTAITNTSLLLNYTNAGIYDGKMANNLETVGNAQVATSPVKYGSGSMYFDGTGDNLTLPNRPIYDFGTGDFTIEGWVYIVGLSGSVQGTFIGRGVNGGASFHIAVSTGGTWLYYLSSNNSSWNIASAVSMGAATVGAWQHIALVRTGNLFTPYLNGIAGTTTTSSSAIYWNSGSSSVNQITIGGSEAVPPLQVLNGYIDDLRITRAARYFTRFTPPQQALPRQ